jgi:predicted house-cleaning noncanonical NTP pyrophosphatase (MazG superfamily)
MSEEVTKLCTHAQYYKDMWEAQKAENAKLVESLKESFYKDAHIEELTDLIEEVEKRWAYKIPCVEQDLRCKMKRVVRER